MKLSKEIIDDIRNSANITDVIGHFIPLVKKGKGYTAVCPFHDDHDPSLSISEDKQIYKCFVCGNGGNVFNFVMNFKKCSFVESVIEVAKIIGKPLNIEYEKKTPVVSKYQKYYDVLDEMVKYTNYILYTNIGSKALDYLENRGLSKEIIDYFNIGFNPSDDALYKFLHEKQFSDEVMLKTNIVRLNDFGQLRDVFYNRILFPIHDINGNTLAFSARAFEGNDVAKYINTSDTLIYTKGDVVYNYHRAIDDAKRAKRIIVCEGVMDVIAFKRANISNVVATLGTAMTLNQLNLIKNLSHHICLCYDGDKAGKAATFKAIKLALSNNIEPFVIENKTGKDPDEIINEGKEKALQNFIDKELTAIEFCFDYLKEIYPLINYTNRKAYNIEMSKLINMIADKYDRDNYNLELKNITGLINNNSQITAKIEYNTKSYIVPEVKTLAGLQKAEYIILSQMILSKKALEIYRHELGSLIDITNSKIASYILEDYRISGKTSIASILDKVKNDEERNVVLDFSTRETLPDIYDEDVYLGAINRVKREIKKTALKNLEKKLKEVSLIDEEATKQYLKDYMKLVKELGGDSDGKD